MSPDPLPHITLEERRRKCGRSSFPSTRSRRSYGAIYIETIHFPPAAESITQDPRIKFHPDPTSSFSAVLHHFKMSAPGTVKLCSDYSVSLCLNKSFELLRSWRNTFNSVKCLHFCHGHHWHPNYNSSCWPWLTVLLFIKSG